MYLLVQNSDRCFIKSEHKRKYLSLLFAVYLFLFLARTSKESLESERIPSGWKAISPSYILFFLMLFFPGVTSCYSSSSCAWFHTIIQMSFWCLHFSSNSRLNMTGFVWQLKLIRAYLPRSRMNRLHLQFANLLGNGLNVMRVGVINSIEREIFTHNNIRQPFCLHVFRSIFDNSLVMSWFVFYIDLICTIWFHWPVLSKSSFQATHRSDG